MSDPSVTVAIPVLNEATSIGRCLDSVDRQTYRQIVEIIVADGGSIDQTREIASGYPKVRVVSNPARNQAAALNRALGEACGEVLVRVDGHAFLAPDYVERCVAVLRSTGAAMVGGPMRAEGSGRIGRAIAVALSSPFGAGPAKFHRVRSSGYVDTVYLGAFRTAQARAIGGYVPAAVPNEDAEFAYRLGKNGGVWIDTSIHSTYAPRESVTALARQFFRYGRGRATTVRRHPRSLSPRQLAAPALVVGLLMPGRRWVACLYAAGLAAVTAREEAREPGIGPGVALAMATMHLCWGAGFWFGLVTGPA